MSDKLKIIIGAAVVVVLTLISESVFVIAQTEQAIVLQFGEPMREV